jgi:large subunit ribosomal protein L17
MRHAKKRLQLNRFTSWHQATLKSLARNLLISQSIQTTLHRAKAVRPLVDKLIGLAKANTLAAKREAARILGDHKLVSLLFTEIGPRFEKRGSGFTRIINLAQRRGDNALIVIFELTEKKIKEPKKPKKEKAGRPEEEVKGQAPGARPEPEKKTETEVAVKEKPPITKKPTKKFLGGLKNIFKKERDSL